MVPIKNPKNAKLGGSTYFGKRLEAVFAVQAARRRYADGRRLKCDAQSAN